MSTSYSKIVYSGYIRSDFEDRFTVDISPEGSYNLRIRDMKINDSGVYVCVESGGFAEEHRMELFVSGKLSIMSYHIDLEEYIVYI